MSSTYKVKANDTLQLISQISYGSSKYTTLLKSANPSIVDENKLAVGQTLTIPDNPSLAKIQAPAPAINNQNISVLIDNNLLENWESVNINDPLDGFDQVTLTGVIDDNILAILKPLQFQTLQLFVGAELYFTGYIINTAPSVNAKAKVFVIQAVTKCAMIQFITAKPQDFDKVNLITIAQTITQGLDFLVTSNVTTTPFDFLSETENNKTIFDFLKPLAHARGLIFSNDALGNLVLLQAASNSIAVADLQENTAPVISINPKYNIDGYYSHIKAAQDVGLKDEEASTATFVNPFLRNITKTKIIQIDNIDGSSAVTEKVQQEASRMFGNVFSVPIGLATIYTPSKQVWKTNTFINLTAPSVLIKDKYKFIVKDVILNITNNSHTANLVLGLPNVYTGSIPSSLPI
jgi:prophage tail gpP-like protein